MKTNFQRLLKEPSENIKMLKELASFQIPMKVNEKIKLQVNTYQYDIYYICPRCKISLERDFQSYCDRCGQRLDWKDYKKAKIVDNTDLYNSIDK